MVRKSSTLTQVRLLNMKTDCRPVGKAVVAARRGRSALMVLLRCAVVFALLCMAFFRSVVYTDRKVAHGVGGLHIIAAADSALMQL